jgi:hypothetical protein
MSTHTFNLGRWMRLPSIFIVLLTFCFQRNMAQSFKYKTSEASEIINGSTLHAHGFPDTITVWGNDWDFLIANPTLWGDSIKYKSNNTFVKFSVNHFFPYTSRAYTYWLTYTIYGINNITDTNAYVTRSDTLSITSTVSPDPEQDLHIKKYSNFYKAIIVVTGILSDTGSYMVPTNISDTASQNFQIEGSIVTQRFDKKSYGSGTPLVTTAVPHVANNYLDVFWNYSPGDTTPMQLTPVNFELEWTYADNYARDLGLGTILTIPSSAVPFDFTNNNTRVWLDSNHYRIPLTYQNGYIVYRVRTVRPDSNLFKYPIYGDWSFAAPSGAVGSLSSSSYYQIIAPYASDSLNWQYSINFAEGGKYKHVVSFFDGLLKNRQSITRFNSDPQKLIVTQYIYDFEGRPSIKTLPAPVSSRGFSYMHNVALDSLTGLPYEAINFDTGYSICPSVQMISPMASNALTSIYYSPLNPDTAGVQAFVPDAKGYPFIQSVYEPGYNDRLSKQGGAGAALQIGNPNAINNFYVGSHQAELNSLFGMNIGWQSYYNMTVTKDPNRQYSMSIKNYEGKQMATALIGPGPDPAKYAITSVDVPPSFSLSEDLLNHTPQMIVGSTKTADHDYFNQAHGTDSLQYLYCYAPFPICPDQAISVKAHYHYDVTDQCGNIVVSQDSTLGVNGIVSGPPDTFAGLVTTFSADVAPYHVHKTLTVEPSDMEATLDSFFDAPPDCFLTENYFIRRSVESRQFPCPAITDPCELKKVQMMEELFPGAKYGKYGHSFGYVIGTDNSIFTVYDGPTTIITGITDSVLGLGFFPFHYRYQDTCTVPSLRDSITISGVTYHHLRTISADSFIVIYNKAIHVQDYSIAEALLPLHPEYCLWKACFNDSFKTQVLAIPDAIIAERMHRLYLDSIVAHDPLVPAMIATYPFAADSLKTFKGGHCRLDSFVITRAYCACDDSIMYHDCVSDMFQYEIANKILINNDVKKEYFGGLVGTYFQNRQRFADALVMSHGDSCWHCALKRMTLIPEPVFSHMITGTGAPSDSITSFSSFVGTGSTVSWMLGLTPVVDSMDSTLTALYDSTLLVYHATDSALCYGQQDTILAKLANCIAGSPLLYTAVKNTLDSFCSAHAIVNGNYTPEQIRFAITRNGIALSDLCNPYVVTYSYLPTPGVPVHDCKPDQYYRDMGRVMSDTGIVNAFGSPGSYHHDTLQPFDNLFAHDIYLRMGGSNTFMKDFATYNAASKLITLFIFNEPGYGPPMDTVKIFLRSPIFGNVFAATADSFIISADCINTVSQPVLNGIINEYSFIATVKKYLSTSMSSSSMLGWVDDIAIMYASSVPISACVPCTQMRDLYQKFNDTLLAYGITGADHPYYDQMLQSFMNHNLHRLFSTNQYDRFIESCALADSMLIPLYTAYSTYTFNDSIDMVAFIDTLNAVDTDYSFDDSYREFDGTHINVLVNLNEVPFWDLWKYKNKLSSYGGTYFSKIVNQNLSTLQSAHELGFLYMVPPATTGTAPISIGDSLFFAPHNKKVWLGDHFVSRKFFDVISTATAPPSRISKDGYEITRYIYNHGLSAVFFPNFSSTVNLDYYLTEKRDYLTYTYAHSQLPTYEVLDSVQSQFLPLRIPSYATDQATYTGPFNPNIVTDLYISSNGMANRFFDTLIHIISEVADSNIVSPGHIFFDTNKVVVITNPDSPLIAYRCGDGTYWYRYFGQGDTLYNVFVAFPSYIPFYDRVHYQVVGFAPALGDSDTRFFTLYLHKAGDTSIIPARGMTTFVIGKNIKLTDVLLGNPATGIPGPGALDTFNNCERDLLNTAIADGILNYDHYVDSAKSAIRAAFLIYLMDSVNEQLKLSYINNEFAYTLYNYDRAGNLISTVPPMGVHPFTGSTLASIDSARAARTALSLGGYTKENNYNYNSINQVVQQTTINGGATAYFYDKANRLILSQNAKQSPLGNFTYTLHDNLNRVIETGQAHFISIGFIYTTADTIATAIHAVNRYDMSMTIYDTAAANLSLIQGLSAQRNLRKRVAVVKYFELLIPFAPFKNSVALG